MPRPPGLIKVSHLAGAAIHYARAPVADYGTRGKARRVSLMPQMADQLHKCCELLWRVCPYGPAEVVVTAGGYVNKPGMHGKGLAFDLDAIWWSMDDFDRPQPIITNAAPHDTGRYLGTEAVLRMFFGGVLDYWTNRAHHDHWHIDLRDVGFRRGSKSAVGFVQAACLHVHGAAPGPLDRLWGPQTRGAVEVVLGDDADLSRMDDWVEFLRLTFERGWKCCEAVDWEG